MGSYTVSWTDTVTGDWSRNSFTSVLSVPNVTASGSTFSVTATANVKRTAGSGGRSIVGLIYSVGGSELKFTSTQTMVVGTAYALGVSPSSLTFNTSSYFTSANAASKTASIAVTRTNISSVTSQSGSNYGKYSNTNTASATTVTVTLNAPPTFDSTQVYFDTPYVYAGYTTAKVDVSDISIKYGGNISSVAFTIGNQTVTGTGNGTLSIPLNAGGTFAPTVKVTDSRGQVTTKTLNAITVSTHTAPSTSLGVERTDSSGEPNDEGENAVVTASFAWDEVVATLSAPTLVATDPNGLPVSVTTEWYSARESDGTFDPQNIISDWSDVVEGASVYCLVTGNNPFNTQYSYQIALTPNDVDVKSVSHSGTTISQTLGSAFYTVDFLAGGHGIAFGQASSEEGFFCNMDAHFVDKADVMRPLFDFFYPVGSYYETSDTSFNPNDSWGGTWHLEVGGQVHVSSGTNYSVNATNTDTVNQDGTVGINQDGEATHTLTPSETATKDHSHTINHNHANTITATAPSRTSSASTYVTSASAVSSYHATISGSSTGSYNYMRCNNSGANIGRGSVTIPSGACTMGGSITQHTGSSGGQTEANGSAHNNMQPYIVVNRWHRTA